MVFGEDTTKVKCHSHHIMLSHGRSPMMLTLIRASICPLSILYSGGKSTHTLTLKEWGISTYIIWKSFAWEICYRNVYIYLFNHLCQYEFMNIYFTVWVIIQCYLTFHSNCSSFGYWELLQLALLSFGHPPPLWFSLSTFFYFVVQDAPGSFWVFIALILE